MKPIEETVATLALGFTIGVMAVIAADKLLEKNTPPRPTDHETLHADKVLELYKRGRIDALTVSGMRPNYELEQACLTLWATKQGAEQ